MPKRKKPLAEGVTFSIYFTHAELLKLELFTRRVARGCRDLRTKIKNVILDAEAIAKTQK